MDKNWFNVKISNCKIKLQQKVIFTIILKRIAVFKNWRVLWRQL